MIKLKELARQKDEILFFGYLKEYSFIFYHLDYKVFPKLKIYLKNLIMITKI